MSKWRGLHNPDYHEDIPEYCLGCNDNCSSGGPCRCCLAAEVERLTEAVGHLRKVETDLTAALAERDRRIRKAIETGTNV